MMPGIDPIAALLNRIEDLERRIRRIVYDGVITDVDHKKGLVRVDDGMGTEDGELHKTDWLPWAEHAGKIKTRTMPSVGQSVRVMSPSGDPTQGMVSIGWFNKNNKMPKAEKGEHVFINGTRYKHVIKNGPEDKQAGNGDGSDSTNGGYASPAEGDTQNGVAVGIHQARVGVLDDDEGSWGDGENTVKPKGDKETFVEHSHDDTGHISYAKSSGDNSKQTQAAPKIASSVDDKSSVTIVKAQIETLVDSSKVTVKTDDINVVASNLSTVRGLSDGVQVGTKQANGDPNAFLAG